MKDEKCGIYCIENVLDGKKYIGLTSRKFARRWIEHKYQLNNNKHENPFLQNSWNKHGEENFIFWIVEICDKELLSEKEKYYISFLSTQSPHGYNLSSGGMEGCIFSDETRAKLSASRTGEKNWRYGKPNSEETRRKISIGNKGKKWSDEGKQNMSVARKGKTVRRGIASKNNNSGYVGVSWREEFKSWESRIKKDGKNIYLGNYKTAEDAALARDKKAIEIFGHDTKLNFDLDYVLSSDTPIRNSHYKNKIE